MNWVKDIPFELRQQIYQQLCLVTPVTVHNVESKYAQGCRYLNDTSRRGPIASCLSLVLTCRAVKAEFEPIFLQETTFIAHFNTLYQHTGYHRSSCSGKMSNDWYPDLGCFNSYLPEIWGHESLKFFKQTESQPLEAFFNARNIQMHLADRKDDLMQVSCTPSFMKQTYDHFVITEPLGCDKHLPHRLWESQNLVELLRFCRGRVRKVQFWWHLVPSEPAEVVAWHIEPAEARLKILEGGVPPQGERRLETRALKDQRYLPKTSACRLSCKLQGYPCVHLF
jgi:hypothetical protein